MPTAIEAEKGIFEYKEPQTVNTEEWLNNHLDCDAIIDDHDNTIVVYAYVTDPRYNCALEGYKKKKDYKKQYILRGISSDGLNSLF